MPHPAPVLLERTHARARGALHFAGSRLLHQRRRIQDQRNFAAAENARSADALDWLKILLNGLMTVWNSPRSASTTSPVRFRRA
jgi:hypothetical protein